MPMFIKVSSYEKLWSCLSLLNSISDLDHGVSVSRRCDKLPESGETCEDVSEEGVSTYYKCNCCVLTFMYLTAQWIHLLL